MILVFADKVIPKFRLSLKKKEDLGIKSKKTNCIINEQQKKKKKIHGLVEFYEKKKTL